MSKRGKVSGECARSGRWRLAGSGHVLGSARGSQSGEGKWLWPWSLRPRAGRAGTAAPLPPWSRWWLLRRPRAPRAPRTFAALPAPGGLAGPFCLSYFAPLCAGVRSRSSGSPPGRSLTGTCPWGSSYSNQIGSKSIFQNRPASDLCIPASQSRSFRSRQK